MRYPIGFVAGISTACSFVLAICLILTITIRHEDTQQFTASRNITGILGGGGLRANTLLKQSPTLQTTPDAPQRSPTRDPHYRELSTLDFAKSLLCSVNVLDFCICNESGLRNAIQRAIPYEPNNKNSSVNTASIIPLATSIQLCRNSQISLTDAIDVSGKSIDIQCPEESTGLLGRRASRCSIDANNGSRIFVGENAQLRISGVDLRNAAVVPFKNDGSNDGGALRLFNSQIEITNCIFSQNEALQGAGGAVFVTGGSLVITGSEFRNNYGGDGGGIAAHDTTMNITDSTFVRNKAASAAGAMILRGGVIAIRSTIFLENTANTAKYGGALACANSDILLLDSVFSGNQALSEQSNDISIYDNEKFENGGTRIRCDRNTTFCNGVEGIFDAAGYSNTNCEDVGQIGIPGHYPCP